MPTKFQVIYWRDIPVQVRVKNGRNRHTLPLSDRFQKTVHRAAYRAKAITGDAYIEEWRPSEWQVREGALVEVATAVAADLEAAYPDQLLDTLARNKGFAEG
ncbi:virulence factor [Candidatus Leptofilum sp.]|uniref:virulence factor n=1 Tax=Candidatus Leptofilum sp. TaxID=3241576 RepID=UPI003B5BDBD2